MADVPTCHPDVPRIRELIWIRGYSMAAFARKIHKPEGSFKHICSGRQTRVGIEYMRAIARGLRVRPGDISDWTSDDEDWEGPIARIPGEPKTPAA